MYCNIETILNLELFSFLWQMGFIRNLISGMNFSHETPGKTNYYQKSDKFTIALSNARMCCSFFVAAISREINRSYSAVGVKLFLIEHSNFLNLRFQEILWNIHTNMSFITFVT